MSKAKCSTKCQDIAQVKSLPKTSHFSHFSFLARFVKKYCDMTNFLTNLDYLKLFEHPSEGAPKSDVLLL